MKKINIIVCISLIFSIAITFLTGCSAKHENLSGNTETSIHMDYPIYNDVEDLSEEAKIVVTGEIIKDSITKEININIGEKREEEPSNVIYTVAELKVESVIKGDVKVGDILEIKQAGGTYNNKTLKVDKVEYLKTGNKGLFFLSERYNFNIPCNMMNPGQGFVEFVDGKVKNRDTQKELFKKDFTEEQVLAKVKKVIEKKSK